jgi:hypothetical protein
MEVKKMYLKLNRVLIILIFLFASLASQAQGSWDWDDCVDWFRHSGVEILAAYAHPTWDINDYTITQTSPDIIITYEFEGNLTDYTCIYKISRSYYNGRPYFKDVKILREYSLVKSFTAWDMLPKTHGSYYRNVDVFHDLYDGRRDFEDLSLGEKAAFGLTMEFIAKQ